MMYNRLLCKIPILFAALTLYSCYTDHATLKLLSQAESIAESNPEKALHIVQSIDRDAIYGAEDEARYALIYSEVAYYNRIYVDCDSLTRGMAEYYRSSDNHNERARALYQHALVMEYSGNSPEAMLALIQAEESVAHTDNIRLEGLIHRSKGDIYGDGCLFKNALDEYNICRECFESINLVEHVAFTQYDIGCVYLQMRDYISAEQHLTAARDYAIESDNYMLLCEVLHELCKTYIHTEEFTKCRATLDLFDSYNCLLFDKHLYYCSKAICEAVEGNDNEALQLLKIANKCEDANVEEVEYAYYVVYRHTNRSDLALAWHERTKNRQDDLILEVLEQPVLNMQVEMLRNKLNSEKRERELIHQRNTIAYTSIAILALLFAAYIWYRIDKKNRDIAQYIDTIKELQLVDRNLSAQMVESISTLYRDRFVELNDLCDIYYDHSGTSRQKNLVFDQLTQTIDAIKSDQRRLVEMEAAVNTYRNNLMQRLRNILPRLNERDYRVALYSLAGFSNRAISLFIDSNPATVSKIKYSIKQKIRKLEDETNEIIIAALSEK